MTKLLAALLCVVSLPWACAGDARVLRVVCGSPVVHDLVLRIGGSRISATSLIAPGVNPHSYQPRPEDAKAIANADLVVINGLGYEGWWSRLVAESGSASAKIIVAAATVKPLMVTALSCPHDHDHDHDHDHGKPVPDPHAFGDVANAIRYCEAIRDGLIRADAAGEAHYRALAELQIAELRALDSWVRRTLSTIPSAQRVIVTNHDALQYFAKAYGFSVVAPMAASDDSQPSAKAIAAIVAQIRSAKIRSVFMESTSHSKIAQQIASEAGVAIGGALYVDGVPTGDSSVSGYRGMIVHNVMTLVAGLR